MEIELKGIKKQREEIKEGDLIIKTYRDNDIYELYMVVAVKEYEGEGKYKDKYGLIDLTDSNDENNYFKLVTVWDDDIYELIEAELGRLGDIRVVKNNKLRLEEI